MRWLKPLLCSLCIATALRAGAFAAETSAPLIPARVKGTMPHNPAHFTQGLFFSNGFLYESTGRYGHSGLFRLDPCNGQELQPFLFPRRFAEGSAALDGVIHVLTWRDGVRYALRESDFKLLDFFPLPGEGWGLCSDGPDLWLSDGSSVLRRVRPDRSGVWEEQDRLIVTDAGKPVDLLNELECVNGLLLANVWQADRIAALDPRRKSPETGECPVLFWIDCAQLAGQYKDIDGAVLNGIAWDAREQRLLLTGKLWPLFYEVELPPEIARDSLAK